MVCIVKSNRDPTASSKREVGHVAGKNSGRFVNLDAIADGFFRKAVVGHASVYCEVFDERLVSVYVWGSVHRNEAVPEVSDLDLHPFILDSVTDADRFQLRESEASLRKEFPSTHGLVSPRSVERVSEVATRLCYDATLIWGEDLIKGIEIPPPDPVGAFRAPRELARYAAGLQEENTTDFSLPDEPSLRLRKLGRLAVLGGGYLLMASGGGYSLKGSEVLSLLEEVSPDWRGFLSRTSEIYVHPIKPSEREVEEYLSHLVEWMDWIEDQLQDHSAARRT